MKIRISFIIFLFLLSGSFFYFVFAKDSSKTSDLTREFFICEEEKEYPVRLDGPLTVNDALQKLGIVLLEGDTIFPSKDVFIDSGLRLYIQRKKTVHITMKDKKYELNTNTSFVSNVLAENNIILKKEDITFPEKGVPVVDGMEIQVIRVEIQEDKKKEMIPYKIQAEESNALGWREKKIIQKGEKGEKQLTYEVLKHDSKEIKRKLIRTEIVKDPVDEKVVQGAYVKLGKKHTGFGTWYSFTGTDAAASPWLPLGSHVRVTNTINGKSVIVVINDRGPFGENRIIDLDKVAFEKIASIGAGVIEVKVEEILN
ncbi:MAG: G5 domain-containing protein [Candidatus Moraniibacteriota bacterium]|nr:MAG: G5 domain-containing protein [Candidatus Moranbacteria bacterium]